MTENGIDTILGGTLTYHYSCRSCSGYTILPITITEILIYRILKPSNNYKNENTTFSRTIGYGIY